MSDTASPAATPADTAAPSPCLSCGLCCSSFRVSFYWGEADDGPGGWVPVAFTESLTPHRRCMRGTNSNSPRCVALEGELKVAVACRIYGQRPSPCREFDSHDPDGSPNRRCQELRAQHGLPPLAFLKP